MIIAEYTPNPILIIKAPYSKASPSCQSAPRHYFAVSPPGLPPQGLYGQRVAPAQS